MRKIFFLIVILILTSPLAHAGDELTIKIGVIVPLSGDMALHGVEIQRAMNLALEQSTPQAKNYSYKLLFEDNRLDGAASVSAAQKLINIDKCDVIVTLWPPTANVVLPLTEKSELLHYTIAWDPSLAKNHKFLLSHQVMVNEIARSTLRLLRHEGKSRVAFFYMEETGFNLGASYIKKLAPLEGVTLVAEESFNPNETDFRSLIARVNTKSPDSYLIWSVMPSIDILVRQIKEIDSNAYITGYLDYAEEMRQLQSIPYVSEMFASESFSKSYKEKYGSEPESKGANAFDILNLLVRAFESSPDKKPSALELKSYLTQVRNNAGAVGTFSVDEFGNSTYSPVVRQAKNGERVLVRIDF